MSTLITKDMEEPKNESTFFIDKGNGYYGTVAIVDEEGDWLLPGVEGELTWEEMRSRNIGCQIEPLAAHDARVRREALTHLSMDDIDAAIRAYENAKYTWNDNNMPLRMAFKAVAENRERVS